MPGQAACCAEIVARTCARFLPPRQGSPVMELDVWHSTRYEFSDAVFLEPHVLRFQPRADGAQTPLEFSLDVDPLPAGMSAALDAAGNTVTHVWFDGLHFFFSSGSRHTSFSRDWSSDVCSSD